MLLGDELRANVKNFRMQSGYIVEQLSPWFKRLSLRGLSGIGWYYVNGKLWGTGIPVDMEGIYDFQLMDYIYNNHKEVTAALTKVNIQCKYCCEGGFLSLRDRREEISIRW